MQHLFVTGLHRSGTTLLEKLLHNHPQVAMASQPAPFLYYHVKQAFLNARNLTRLYPIDPQFPEADYRPADFTRFLETHPISTSEIQELFRQMEGYESQYSPELLSFGPELKGGSFAQVYAQICSLTRHHVPEKKVTWRGTKEIIGEEFMEALTLAGAKCLLVIRDPRDMLLSTNSGKELGQVRPTLYYLRMWRKSVAFAIGLQANPNLLVLRYEDLVTKPQSLLSEIARFLHLPHFPEEFTAHPLQSQQGENWQGNSAFGKLPTLSTNAVGRYKTRLSAEAIALVEAYCFPEMRLLGYPCQSVTNVTFRPELLQRQREVFAVTHRQFQPDFTHLPPQTDQEMHRASLLLRPETASATEAEKYFIYPTAYQALRNALRQ